MRSGDKQSPVVFLSGGAGFTAQNRVLEGEGAANRENSGNLHTGLIETPAEYRSVQACAELYKMKK